MKKLFKTLRRLFKTDTRTPAQIADDIAYRHRIKMIKGGYNAKSE